MLHGGEGGSGMEEGMVRKRKEEKKDGREGFGGRVRVRGRGRR